MPRLWHLPGNVMVAQRAIASRHCLYQSLSLIWLAWLSTTYGEQMF